MLRENNPNIGRPLSKGSVVRIHSVLHCALEDLVQAGQLPSNPARGARPRRTKSERYEYRIWTHNEMELFLSAATGHRFQTLWRVMAYTGLRRGEAIGLQRADLRMESRQLSVRRALAFVDGAVYVTRPKTDAERVIELDLKTVRALRTHLRQSSDSSADSWVFPGGDGGPLTPGHVTTAFKDLVASTDLPQIRLHDLRHTHASHLILAGANIKAVQERLGHSGLPQLWLTPEL